MSFSRLGFVFCTKKVRGNRRCEGKKKKRKKGGPVEYTSFPYHLTVQKREKGKENRSIAGVQRKKKEKTRTL